MGLSSALEGKTAIVTGSGNGIGRAIAMRFAAEGAKVTVAEIEEDSGQETVELIAQAGGTAIFSRTDTTDSESIKASVAVTKAAHGEVDLLVNNAAAFVFGKIEDITQDDWMKVFGVNVIGYANCVREVLPSMRRQNGGAIVNIALEMEKPLLLTGEAGTGKTQLAFQVAKALDMNIEVLRCKSTIKGEEACYAQDTVLRLNDARFGGSGCVQRTHEVKKRRLKV